MPDTRDADKEADKEPEQTPLKTWTGRKLATVLISIFVALMLLVYLLNSALSPPALTSESARARRDRKPVGFIEKFFCSGMRRYPLLCD